MSNSATNSFSGLNPERPNTIPISPSSSIQSLQFMNSRTNSNDTDGTMKTDSGPLEGCGDYLSENLKITTLMAEYAEKDKHYESAQIISVDEGPPRPMLIPTFINDSHETSKDGPRKIAKKIFTALRINKGERNLSLATNQPPDSGQTCLYVYHHSGSPSPGMSLLSLNPAQSPRVSPLYTPDNVHYGEVISYLPAGKETGTPTPGTDVVKMESRTHVYLALDYTDEDKPKLLAIEEKAMENVLTKVNEGMTEQKIKPIVHVRTNPDPTKITNDTAFYFKTEKNYHFVAVNETTLRLEVKSVPVAKKTKDTYNKYLSFNARPQPEGRCPRSLENHKEEVDTPHPMKKAIPTSPTSDLGTDKADSDRSKKSSICSSSGSTSSDAQSPGSGKFKFEGTASDSGVDDGPKDLHDEAASGSATLVAN